MYKKSEQENPDFVHLLVHACCAMHKISPVSVHLMNKKIYGDDGLTVPPLMHFYMAGTQILVQFDEQTFASLDSLCMNKPSAHTILFCSLLVCMNSQVPISTLCVNFYDISLQT